MALSYKILPDAQEDLIKALQWYEAEAGTKTRDRFMKDYILTRTKACKFPALFSPFYKNFRKFRFSKFPFKIIYQIQKDIILIVAIAHDSRIAYWEDRV